MKDPYAHIHTIAELAELVPDPELRSAFMDFVILGKCDGVIADKLGVSLSTKLMDKIDTEKVYQDLVERAMVIEFRSIHNMAVQAYNTKKRRYVFWVKIVILIWAAAMFFMLGGYIGTLL